MPALPIAFLLHRLRTVGWTMFYRTLGRFVFTRMGRGCRFEGPLDIPQRGGSISLGDNVHFCRLVELSVPAGGCLEIANDVFIGRGVVISAHCAVRIGSDSMIGEYASLHDNDHVIRRMDLPIRDQGFESCPLIIGVGAWIGAGARLLRTTEVGDGSIIGAGGIVKGKIPSWSIAVGVPARVIRQRDTGVSLPAAAR